MVYDAIVAGAGLWGCTIARRLAESGQRVLVLEKRKAVGEYRYYDMDKSIAAALEVTILQLRGVAGGCRADVRML